MCFYSQSNIQPIIVLALQKFFVTPTEEVLVQLYNSLNQMDLSGMPRYTDHEKQIIRSSNDKSKQEYTAHISFDKTNMKIRIPTTLFPDEVGDVTCWIYFSNYYQHSLITLVRKFGNQVMLIYNALITQKRILFLGFDCSAGEVCEYTLAACSMVCPPLKGLVKRAFPYTNLTYLDFLNVYPIILHQFFSLNL